MIAFVYQIPCSSDFELIYLNEGHRLVSPSRLSIILSKFLWSKGENLYQLRIIYKENCKSTCTSTIRVVNIINYNCEPPKRLQRLDDIS